MSRKWHRPLTKRKTAAAEHNLFMISGHSSIRHCLNSVKCEQLTTKMLKRNTTDLKTYWAGDLKHQKWHRRLIAIIQIAPGALKECSCQSFSASNIGPRATARPISALSKSERIGFHVTVCTYFLLRLHAKLYTLKISELHYYHQFLYWTAMLWWMNWQLSKQGIHWPVSRDHIVGPSSSLRPHVFF